MIHGYFIFKNNHYYVIKTEQTRKSKKLAQMFIHYCCKHFKHMTDAQMVEWLNDKRLIADVMYNMTETTIVKRRTQSMHYEYYEMTGKYYSYSLPAEDFQHDVTIIE